MAKQSKQLTITDLNKLDKVYDELRTIPLANGQYTCDINVKFRDTKVQRFILDFQDASAVLRKEKVSLEDVKNLFMIFNALLIKHFTNLGLKDIDVSTEKGLSQLLKVADKLVDTGVFREIVEAFDPNEIEKINRIVTDSNVMKEQLGEIFVQYALQSQTIKEESGESDAGLQESQGTGNLPPSASE